VPAAAIAEVFVMVVYVMSFLIQKVEETELHLART